MQQLPLHWRRSEAIRRTFSTVDEGDAYAFIEEKAIYRRQCLGSGREEFRLRKQLRSAVEALLARLSRHAVLVVIRSVCPIGSISARGPGRGRGGDMRLAVVAPSSLLFLRARMLRWEQLLLHVRIVVIIIVGCRKCKLCTPEVVRTV